MRTRAIPTGRAPESPLRGIAFIVASTVFFSCSDIATKYLAESLPAIEIAWLRYVGFTLIVVPALIRLGPGTVLGSQRPGLQVLRGLGMVGSALLFTFGLHFLPVAEATAMNFVSPIFITALSIPFLGEVVGIRRWLAAFAGLAGVLIVIRPGTGSFDAAAVFPVLAAFSWACAAIVTRKMSGADRPVTTMAYSAFAGLAALTILLPFAWVAPDLRAIALGAFVGVFSTTGHWFVVLAYRHADASVLAPISYGQLVLSATLGYLAFGSVPDFWTFVGAGVIVASALYTAHREQLRAHAASRRRRDDEASRRSAVISPDLRDQ